MIQSLIIENFRSLKHFEMCDLGRINLLVGTNNSGKTSVLEAIQLAASRGDSEQFLSIGRGRGEIARIGNRGVELAIRHLFHGHELIVGDSFTIRLNMGSVSESFTADIAERESTRADRPLPAPERDSFQQLPLLYEPGDDLTQPRYAGLVIKLRWSGSEDVERRIRLTREATVSPLEIDHTWRRRDGAAPVASISTAALSVHQVKRWFNETVLTPEEDQVLEALRTIEPTLDRIAAVSEEVNGSGRGDIVVKLRGVQQRIPIGSMGDGIWRMLGLALALAHAENGVLLVDEIDTGLHYTVMDNMWKMVRQTAERLNVQVFATTHSRDCYESLAIIASENVSAGSQVTLQRLERGQQKAVAYTEQEIVVAAKRGLEVR